MAVLAIANMWWFMSSTARAERSSDGYAIYYVAPGGNCGGQTPCYGNIQDAVSTADDANDVIKVAAGLYTGVRTMGAFGSLKFIQVVVITKTLTLRGGYTTANWTTPDPYANPTILEPICELSISSWPV